MPKSFGQHAEKEPEQQGQPEAGQSKEDKEAVLQAKLRGVFDEQVAAGAEEDAIKLAMISAGATFKNVTRLYNEFMVAGGHAATKEEREQKVLSAVEGHDLATEEGFNAAVKGLVGSLQGATEKSASAMVRAHAKKAGVTAFKRTKEASGEGRTGFTSLFYDYLLQNPSCTKEQATAFIMGTDGNAPTSTNTQNHLSGYLNIWSLVNRISQLPKAA